LPPLFSERYPNELETFNKNVDKLITPMDIHSTLADLIRMEMNRTKSKETSSSIKGSKSLFTEKILKTRTCSLADIDEHWCACLKRTKIPTINARLIKMANSFVSHINGILKEYLNFCNSLELSNINHVYLLDSVIPKIKEEKPFSLKEWFNSLMNKIFNWYLVEPDLERDYKKYLFQIVTKPNNGTYEFTIVDESNIDESETNLEHEQFEIDLKGISRIDKYGHQPYCIENKFPELRKYCFCKL